MQLKTHAAWAAVGLSLTLAFACSGDSENSPLNPTTSSAGGSNSNGTASGGGGNNSGTTSSVGGGFLQGPSATGSGGGGGDDSCAQSEATATIINRPVDIIFVIDNSGSMSDEIEDVEEQINQNFATIIDSATPAIDYRVIMLSKYGSASADQEVCVGEPLGGIPDVDADGHCDLDNGNLPAAPVNTTKFFHHSPNEGGGINSHNALCQLGAYFDSADEFMLQPDGYKQVLRDEAFKFIVVVSDDRPDDSNGGCSFGTYDDGGSNTAGAQLMACRWIRDITSHSTESNLQFGGPLTPPNDCTDPSHLAEYTDLNFQFHSIIGIAPYNASAGDPYGDPHPPDVSLAPITNDECTPDAVDSAQGYQWLSVHTGAYRFPSCGLDYSKMFQIMAQGVIDGAAVPCEFEIPDPPMGETLDLSTVVVNYTHGDGTEETFFLVPDANACTDSSFYIENDLIKLCTDACAKVQADEDAEIDIKFGCEVEQNVPS